MIKNISGFFKKIQGVKHVVLYGSSASPDFEEKIKSGNYINDIDVVIIIDEYFHDINARKKIVDFFKNSYMVESVDISFLTANSFKEMFCKKSIWAYDFYESHSLIYGCNENFKELIYRFESNLISVYSIHSMFYTRLWAVMYPFSNYKKDNKYSQNFVLQYQMAKAILACVDFKLLSEGNYHTNLINKLNIYQEVFPSAITNVFSKNKILNIKNGLVNDTKGVSYIETQDAMFELIILYNDYYIDFLKSKTYFWFLLPFFFDVRKILSAVYNSYKHKDNYPLRILYCHFKLKLIYKKYRFGIISLQHLSKYLMRIYV